MIRHKAFSRAQRLLAVAATSLSPGFACSRGRADAAAAAASRGFDAQAHETAHAVAETAQHRDSKAVIQSFAKVQESCPACRTTGGASP